MLYRRLSCDEIATRVVKSPHRLVQSHPTCVEVRVSLADVRVPEHFLDVMDRALLPMTPGERRIAC